MHLGNMHILRPQSGLLISLVGGQLAATLMHRLLSAPMRRRPSSVQTIAAAAPSDSGAHIGRVIG